MRFTLQGRERKPARAFTLVEMLAVLAIIGILLALLVPSINSFSSTYGRKSAVNVVMSTLDQARAVALQTGGDVYVLLWRREFPDRDALMVLRSPSDWMTTSAGTPETQLIPLTKWIPLPEGVLLHKPDKGENVFSVSGWPDDLAARKNEIPVPSGQTLNPKEVGVISYSGNGSILQPDAGHARIVITEGVRGVGGTEARISSKKNSQAGKGGGFEIIRLSRFTGRSWLEVSTVE